MPCVAREALDIHILSHFVLPRNDIMPSTTDQNYSSEPVATGSSRIDCDANVVLDRLGQHSQWYITTRKFIKHCVNINDLHGLYS
jgi:hypothetical protein